jgi:hypothetical protein
MGKKENKVRSEFSYENMERVVRIMGRISRTPSKGQAGRRESIACAARVVQGARQDARRRCERDSARSGGWWIKCERDVKYGNSCTTSEVHDAKGSACDTISKLDNIRRRRRRKVGVTSDGRVGGQRCQWR